MDRPRIASGFLDGSKVYDSFRGEVIISRNRMDQAGKSKNGATSKRLPSARPTVSEHYLKSCIRLRTAPWSWRSTCLRVRDLTIELLLLPTDQGRWAIVVACSDAADVAFAIEHRSGVGATECRNHDFLGVTAIWTATGGAINTPDHGRIGTRISLLSLAAVGSLRALRSHRASCPLRAGNTLWSRRASFAASTGVPFGSWGSGCSLRALRTRRTLLALGPDGSLRAFWTLSTTSEHQHADACGGWQISGHDRPPGSGPLLGLALYLLARRFGH